MVVQRYNFFFICATLKEKIAHSSAIFFMDTGVMVFPYKV